MLRKLFKYDFLAIGKTMWLLTLIVAITTTTGIIAGHYIYDVGNLLEMTEETGPALATIALLMLLGALILIGFAAIIAYMVLSVIMITKRYYQNLFTDEGYLTFTLPAKTSTILNAKILAGALWAAIATIVSIFSFCFLVVGITEYENAIGFKDVSDIFTYFYGTYDIPTYHYTLLFIEYGLTIVIEFMFSILLLYFCITFASVIAKRARVILGIGIYAGVTSVLSTLVQIVTSILPYILEEELGTYDARSLVGQMHFQFCFMIVVYGGVAVASYLLNRYLLKNKLNLV